MIGWYVALAFAALAFVFFLVYLYEWWEHKEDERMWRRAETAWGSEREQFMELVKKHIDNSNALQLQLDEALKTKPLPARKPRASTKKERIEP